MEQLKALETLGYSLPVIAAVAAWMSPDALRWCLMRLSMRVAYLEAGRQASEQEFARLSPEIQQL